MLLMLLWRRRTISGMLLLLLLLRWQMRMVGRKVRLARVLQQVHVGRHVVDVDARVGVHGSSRGLLHEMLVGRVVGSGGGTGRKRRSHGMAQVVVAEGGGGGGGRHERHVRIGAVQEGVVRVGIGHGS